MPTNAMLNFLWDRPQALREKAFDPEQSKGRRLAQDSDSWMDYLMNPFAVDQHKIEQSKASRRQAYKTQVFSLQFNPHIRTRLIHAQEVAGLSALIASVLGLNIDLTVSIAKAHDTGHVPFGHAGERFIEKVTGSKFDHAAYGAVVLQEIERGGGANFSFEVLEGVYYHSGKPIPEGKPLEYSVVHLCDKIAYVSHDINDAARKGFTKQIPAEIISILGETQRERIKRCALALASESALSGRIQFERFAEAKAFRETREWLFENVYRRIDDGPCFGILQPVYDHFAKEVENEGSVLFGFDPLLLITMMTDWGCWRLSQAIISNAVSESDYSGLLEILPFIKNKKFAPEPDFSWAEKK